MPVAPPSCFQRASPVEVSASPAAAVKSPEPPARSPLIASFSDTLSRSGRPIRAATTPPFDDSSASTRPSTLKLSRVNPTSALRCAVGPSLRTMSSLRWLRVPSAGSNADPASFQCESTPPSAAPRCRSSTDKARRSTPIGRLTPPPDDDDVFVSEGAGGLSTSMRRAATSSILTRPPNSDANDQLSRASSTVSQAPSRSDSFTWATRRSVGKNPLKPAISRSLLEMSDASARWPGPVCKPTKASTSTASKLPAIQARRRRHRIRRPARC